MGKNVIQSKLLIFLSYLFSGYKKEGQWRCDTVLGKLPRTKHETYMGEDTPMPTLWQGLWPTQSLGRTH